MSGGEAVTYRLRVLPRGSGGEALREDAVPSEHWRDYLQVRIPGFDGSALLDLSDAWAAFRAGGCRSYEGNATSRETIVKFGDTRQLREEHRVRIELEPERGSEG